MESIRRLFLKPHFLIASMDDIPGKVPTPVNKKEMQHVFGHASQRLQWEEHCLYMQKRPPHKLRMKRPKKGAAVICTHISCIFRVPFFFPLFWKVTKSCTPAEIDFNFFTPSWALIQSVRCNFFQFVNFTFLKHTVLQLWIEFVPFREWPKFFSFILYAHMNITHWGFPEAKRTLMPINKSACLNSMKGKVGCLHNVKK